MIYDEENYWNEQDDVDGNFYDNLVAYMKYRGRTIGEIKYVVTEMGPSKADQEKCDGEDCDECPYQKRVEIDKDDFFNLAKEVEIHNISDRIRIVGEDFFITTNTDNFFEMIELPGRPKEKLNLAKELLTSNNEDKINIPLMVGIAYDDDDDEDGC